MRERERLTLWLPVCLGAGVALYFRLGAEPPAWAGAAAFALAAVASRLVPAWSWRRGLFTACAALAAGLLAAQTATWRAAPLEPIPGKAAIVAGRVTQVELLPDGAHRVTLTAPSLHDHAVPLARDLRIRLRADDLSRPEAGDTLRVRALLRPPSPPSLPGAWDGQRDAFFAGLAGFGRALGPASVTPAETTGLANRIERLRQAVDRRFTQGLPGAEGAVGSALFSGFMAAIPRADIAAFRDSGLAHLLSVSGLHVAIVFGLVFGLVRATLALSEHAALHWPCKQIAAVAGLAAAALYLPLAGAQVPLLRSVAMAALVVLAILTGRRALSMRSLGLAAASVLLVAPSALTGPSFQMSFAAVLALIAGHEAARPWLLSAASTGGRIRCLALRLGAPLFTSLLAGAATMPYGIYHFGRAPSWFMLANLLAVPLTGLWIMPCGLAALALMPFGWESLALLPMGWGMSWLLALARQVAALPAATSDIPSMPLWGLLAVTAGLLWLAIWRTPWRLAGIAGVLLGLASPWVTRPADILVSADARLLAMRTDVGVFVQSVPGASPIILESWARYWATNPSTTKLPDAVPNAIACHGLLCRLGPAGDIRLLRQGQTLPDGACPGARLVIALEPLPQACPDTPKIDRFSVWREGAQAIWLAPSGPRVLSDRAARGQRPWVELPIRRRPDLPEAASE